jgi:hypothetical protein
LSKRPSSFTAVGVGVAALCGGVEALAASAAAFASGDTSSPSSFAEAGGAGLDAAAGAAPVDAGDAPAHAERERRTMSFTSPSYARYRRHVCSLTRSIRCAALLLLFVACKEKKTPAPAASTAVAIDAAPAIVDLLYETNAVVAVSSRVNNPRDLPDHLVDRKPETAWNGRTGDLVGAWIAFRVPTDAHVDYLTMSAGFDKKTDAGDLFLMNHRVAEVEVSRNGAAIRTATLSTDERKPQRIDIGSMGGEFKMKITRVVPGTRSAWREITVSELAVFGTKGATARAKPGPPVVRVGSLDPRSIPFTRTVGDSYEAACKKFVADETDAANEANAGLPQDDDERTAARCDAPTTRPRGREPVTEIAHVAVTEASKGMYRVRFDGELLALRTRDDVLLTNVRISGKESAWFWTVSYTLRAERWTDAGKLVVEVDEHRVTDSDGYAPPGHEADLHSEVRSVITTECDARTLICSTSATESP